MSLEQWNIFLEICRISPGFAVKENTGNRTKVNAVFVPLNPAL